MTPSIKTQRNLKGLKIYWLPIGRNMRKRVSSERDCKVSYPALETMGV
jgi:hypothetical protein